MTLIVPLAYPAAIPVGHRVELTWYLKPAGVARRKLASAPPEPFLVDLDSGVRYGVEWQLGEHLSFRSDRPNRYELDPLPHLQAERIVRGRVAACTIVHVSLSEPYQQTMLLIDEEENVALDSGASGADD
jgi:hypothetical protein